MSSNQIANALHAGGLLTLRSPELDGGPRIEPGSWGLRSIRFEPGNQSGSIPPAYFVSLLQPIYGKRPFDTEGDAVASGHAVCTPQVGGFNGSTWVPFITYAGLIPADGPEPGGVRIIMQDPRTPNTWVTQAGQLAIMMSLVVFKFPTVG